MEKSKKIPVKRNLHAYKYDTLFGLTELDRKPIINPHETNPIVRINIMLEKLERSVKGLVILNEILPLIIDKYPKLKVKYQEFASGIKVVLEYINPITDGRWDRSWAEWEEIAEYSKAHGYNAASRRFYAIKEGEKIYLSPKYIKQKIKQLDEFYEHLEIITRSHKYLLTLQEIIRKDNELMEKSLQFSREYDENKNQVSSQIYNNVNSSKIYAYTYYYIRHYDPIVYRKRKSDYNKGLIKKKSQISGKIECGPFKKEDFPAGAVERYQYEKNQREFILLYLKIVFILSIRPSNSIDIQKIIETEAEEIINLRLEDLRTVGIVIRLKYSNVPNKNYSAHHFNGYSNGSSYYSLNWSNPKSKMMFVDYQEKCTKRDMLKIIRISKRNLSI